MCAGINKPGGTAWVTRVNEDGTYDVKYVLGNSRDLAVPGDFVAAQGAETGHAEIGPSGRTPRKPRRSSCSDKEPSADGVCSRTSSPKGPNSEGKSSLLDKKESLPAKAPQRMSLLSSQLDDGSQNYLATFVAQFDAEIAHNYCPDVTHLVVNVNKNKVVEQRTMKYLKSMSGT